jgi:uncharacterized protein (TIGR02099 family)
LTEPRAKSVKARGRLRRLLVRLVALGIVGCALVISLAKLSLPWLSAHPERVESYLSAWLHTEVKIGRLESEWQARPKLKVQKLRLGASGLADRAVEIGEVEIELDPFGFVPGRRWVRDFSIIGAELTLTQSETGWHVDGLGQTTALSNGDTNALNLLSAIGQLSIHDAILNVRTASGKALRVENAAVALRRQDGVLRAALQFSPPSVESTARGVVSAVTRGQVSLRTRWHEGSDQLSLYLALRDSQMRDLGALTSLLQNNTTRELEQFAGALDAEFWLTLRASAPLNGRLKLAARDARDLPTLHLALVSSDGQLWPGALSFAEQAAIPFQLQLLDFAVPARRRLTLQLASVETPLDIAAFSQVLGAHLPVDAAATLARFGAKGKVEHLSAQFDAQTPWRVQLDTQQLEIAPVGHIPGIRGANVQFNADPSAASMALRGKDFVLSALSHFRRPIKVDQITLNAAAWPDPQGWQQGFSAEISDIALHAPGYDATAYARIEKQADLPAELTVALDCSRGDISKAGQFWTIDKMPPKVIAWLDSALLRGQTGNAKAIYRGPLKHGEFPFMQAQGRFEAQFELKDADIKFSPDWPALTVKTGEFSLLNASFVAHQAEGSIVGNPIRELTGDIENFKLPIARFSVKGGSDAGALIALLRQSPIGRDFGTHFSGLQASGGADVALDLLLPLKAELGERVVSGSAKLQNAALNNLDWQLDLSGVSGAIAFDRAGFSAKNLSAIQKQLPVRLSAAVGESHTAQAKVLIDASLEGAMRPTDLFAHELVLAPILAKISGASEWRVRVKTLTEVAHLATAPGTTTTIELSSDLAGVAIDLPPPLGKVASNTRNLRLSVPSEKDSERALVLDIEGGVRFVSQLGNAARAFRGALILGEANQQTELPAQGLRIAGALDSLNIVDWAALVGGTAAAAGGISLADVKLEAKKLTGALAQFPGAMRLSAQPSAQGWRVDIDSTAAKGHLLWRTDLPTATLTAQFKHLHMPEFDSSSDMQSSIDPRLVPTLHLYVEDFSVGSAQLGATRLESFPTREGMRIDLLESKSSDLTLTGSGDWKGAGSAALSTFKLNFAAQDLGRMLAGLGFAGHVEGGQTLAEIDAHWQGAPPEFALAKLNGKLKVWVGNGRFLELSPGAGRLFGLLSLRELPRRLALDFRDFFQSGMSFSEIKGSFNFADGNAFTEGVHIKAPAADITIVGRTGLSARDYEQTALVSPKIGMLPVVGAIAGGPAGAAAGFLAQGVLEGEKTLAANYRISGSWEQPLVVKQIARREATRESPEKKR